jgi:hypothetical protein
MKKEAAGIINACSNLVMQLDAHPAGGALFIAALAMVMLVVVVVCLSGSRRPPKSS